MLRSDVVESIARDELVRVKNAQLRELGERLLVEWMAHPQEEFCKRRVAEEIAKLRGRMRSKAEGMQRNIKEKISQIALRQMLDEERQRRSARLMQKEALSAFDVINRQGRGVVYLGSARSKPGDPDYEAGKELGYEVANMLKVTSWSGAGPGAMECALVGAKAAGQRIGGVKIMLNNEESSFEQEVSSIFAPGEVALCKYFAPRKVGLVDAAMAETPQDKRAVVVLPGGFGTADEFFEFLTLKQLNKLGSARSVPALLMNYGGYYDNLLVFLHDMLRNGKISPRDLELFRVCANNREGLDFLADEYAIPEEERAYRERLMPWETFYPRRASAGQDQPLLHRA